MSATCPATKTQKASDLINLDTYTREDRLIISKAKGDKTFIGRVYVMSPLLGGGGEFATVVHNLFKSAADDSLIQMNLMCAPDYDAPSTYKKGKSHGGEMITELVNRQAKILKNASTIGWQHDVPLLNKRTLVVSFAQPAKVINESTLSEAASAQADFLNNMRGCGFFDIEPLTAGEVLGYYRKFGNIFTPYKPVELDELVELKFQVFGPDNTINFMDDKAGVFDGETYCSAVTVKSYPEVGYQGLMNLVTGAPFNSGTSREGGGQRILTPFIVNTTIRVANQRKEMERVENAIKSRQHENTLPIKLGNEDPKKVMEDLQLLKSSCGSDGDKYAYVSTTAFVFGLKREETIESAMVLKSSLDKLGFDGRAVRSDAIVRWAQSLPLNYAPGIANKLACEAIMQSSAAGCLMPVYGDNWGNARTQTAHTGIPFVTRRGTAHYWDIFVSDSNYNGLLCAPPGKGKSFVLQNIIANHLAEGSNVFLFDNGRSAKKFCEAVRGEFNEFTIGDKTKRTSLNPFTNLSEAEFNDQQEVITSLLLLMAYEGEPVQPGAKIAMSEAVRAAWGQRQDQAEIQTVIASLDSIRQAAEGKQDMTEVERAAGNLIPRLNAFISSPSRGEFFKGPGTINMDQQFTVFELGGLSGDDHLRKCVMFFALNMLMSRIKAVKGRKLVFVDEAHDLFKDPAAESVMEGIYLKGRKDSVAVMVIVQSLLKLVNNPTGRVILNMSAWKLLLQQNEEEIDRLFSEKVLTAFPGDEYFKRLVRSVQTVKGQYSEILFIGERQYEVGRYYTDKFTATLFSSEGDARDAVFDMMKQGIGAVEAVNAILGEKKASRTEFLRAVLDQVFSEDKNLTSLDLIAEVKELTQ